MKLTYSINKQCVGKQHGKLGLPFVPVNSDLETFIQDHYFNGYAIASGIFLGNYRNNDNWLYSQLVIIDIDENLQDIRDVWNHPFIQDHCFAAIPSSTYTPQEKKYHLYFNVDVAIQDEKYYRRVVQWVSNQFDATTDRAMMKPAQPCYGTVFSKINHTKGYDDGLLLINERATPLNYDLMYSEVKQAVNKNKPIDYQHVIDMSRKHSENDTVSKRAVKHHEQPYVTKLEVTLDALDYACRRWGRQEYDYWLALTMSAWDASPDYKVRDFILNHPDINWDDDDEKANFVIWWDGHKPKSKGYTVATLFMLARANGWLQETTMRLTDYTEFNAPDVGTWLLEQDTLPKRVLINSGLGTGKTLGAIAVLKRLGVPKSVFFAPSIKLCTNLSAILTSHGIDNTLYIDGNTIKESNVLQDANVLVTTLQTFANKLVAKDVDISQYQYVVIDECDDLISSFARSDTYYTLGYSSHVKKHESQWGFYALQKIFEQVEYIYMLDGTATKISTNTADSFTVLHEPLTVLKNTWIRKKAPVYMLDKIYEARRIVVDTIEGGYSIVIAADTKRECNLLYEYILDFGSVKKSDVLLITGDTHNQANVKQFFKDVEQGAKNHRVVIYNSAMGSGVSITDTKPQVFVQICSHISPRRNIQILNRYRQLSIVYVHTQRSENLYSVPIEERLQTIEDVVSNETQLTGLAFEQRGFIADTIKHISTLAVVDEYEQRRSYRDMYIGLLKADGREVIEPLSDIDVSDGFKQSFKQARQIIADQHEIVCNEWRSVDPINKDNPPYEGITQLDYAKGILHNRLIDFLDDIDNSSLEDHEMATLFLTVGRYVRTVERYINLNSALKTTIENSQNERNSLTTFKLYLSRLECVSQLGLLFETSLSKVDTNDLNAPEFLRAIELRKPTYNLIARRKERLFDAIVTKFADSPVDAALSIAKVLLHTLGLKIKRTNGKKQADGSRSRRVDIKGNEELVKMLSLRGVHVGYIVFDAHKLIDYSTTVKPLSAKFTDLDKREQREVMERLKDGILTFEDSMNLLDVVF